MCAVCVCDLHDLNPLVLHCACTTECVITMLHSVLEQRWTRYRDKNRVHSTPLLCRVEYNYNNNNNYNIVLWRIQSGDG